jgi:hypothetical protein
MKVNYQVLKDLNVEALSINGDQLSCYWVIQSGIEKYLNNETLTEQHKEFLIQLNVLVESEEDIARKNIVGPFKFSTDGTTNS